MTKHSSRKTGPLHGVLNRRVLRRYAGSRSFERGAEYFEADRVGTLVEDRGILSAAVQGTRAYRVKLWIDAGDLDYSCTCPVGQDGDFCKHCVAVGLAWLAGRKAGASSSKRNHTGKAVTMDDVRAALHKMDKQSLVEMLVAHGMEDDRLRQRLFMRAARTVPKRSKIATYRKAIDDAIGANRYVDYYEAYAYASGIEESIEALKTLLKEGDAEAVIELTEHALAGIEEAIGYVDDSDGHMGGILHRLQEIHLKACRKARPDPKALAERLFSWELRTEWDTFDGAAQTYARVLGRKGLDAYRRHAETEWSKVRPLKPGDNDSQRYGSRFRITRIMETLARRSRGVEALVAVMERDLASSYSYLRIAETYKAAREYKLALEWAEKGVQVFPEDTDPRLHELLANEYHRRRRHDEAMSHVWAQFEGAPSLHQYQNLKRHADKCDQWPSWRSKALGLLRDSAKREKQNGKRMGAGWGPWSTHSDLVRILLWEKDIDAAWREATQGGCSEDLWLELANRRERDHPADALPIYQRRITAALDRAGNDAYREAVEFLKRARRLMKRLDRNTEFKTYLESLRNTHKRKRNFTKLLDANNWST